MSIYGKYVLVAQSGKVIRESSVPMKPWLDLGQKLVFYSGDIFTNEPMPGCVVHVHHDNFSVTFFCEDVSVGDVKKYRHNFKVTSAPEVTPELVEAIEHFFFDAADFVDEKIAVRNQYYRFFQPLIIAREEMKKEEESNKAMKEFYSLLDEIYDPFLDAILGLGDRHEPMATFLPGFCGIGIEKRNPFSHHYSGCFNPMERSISGFGGWHGSVGPLSDLDAFLRDLLIELERRDHDSAKGKSDAAEKPAPNTTVSDDACCPKDDEPDRSSEEPTPDGSAAKSPDASSPDEEG